MRAMGTTEPTSRQDRKAGGGWAAVDEAKRILLEAGELDHHGQHMSAGELVALECLYPEGGARLTSLAAGLSAFVLSAEPWWVCQIGGTTHRKRLWRFGNVNGAKRLHVVNPPGYGSDRNHMAMCGTVVDAFVDDRGTPVCPKCRKLMEREEDE